MMYETAKVATRTMRLRLHIGLMSGLKHLEDEVIHLLSTDTATRQVNFENSCR